MSDDAGQRSGEDTADGGASSSFLTGGGEMAALMRRADWSASPLGPPEGWPQSLRSVVGLMLTSKFPMFVAWGPDLGFLYNDAYVPILGAKHPAALGRRFADIWSEIWDDVGPLVASALAGEATFHEDLPLLMQRKGFEEQTYFTFSYSPVRDESGAIAGMFCACTETTGKIIAQQELRALNETLEQRVAERTAEREAALAQLAHAQKMDTVGQLTGGVAHDFNNLLQALGGCLTLIGRRSGEPSVKPLLEAGHQAVERGARLVQQLMAFARHESLRPTAIDIRDCVVAMSELLARALRADIRLTTAFAPGLWRIEADATQFELALMNLAINARDAMPGGGTVTIAARNRTLADGGIPEAPGITGEVVHLSVSDTGQGMPEAVRNKAFEPFFTTKEVGRGSGLGLAQVYGLAQRSGGTAWIDSREGAGTTVHLLLRRTVATAATEADTAPHAAVRRSRAARILLVEDDVVVGTIVAAALEDEGYTVSWVTTADEAMSRLSDGGGNGAAVDLVFSDIVMPGRLSGIDLARALRDRHPDVPVVLTSGYTENVAQAQAFRILRKPYRVEELVATLDDVLSAGPS